MQKKAPPAAPNGTTANNEAHILGASRPESRSVLIVKRVTDISSPLPIKTPAKRRGDIAQKGPPAQGPPKKGRYGFQNRPAAAKPS